MKEWGYGENDYFYFNDCIIQYDSELYIDRHGNKVVRPPENMKLAFMGYDNYIEFAEEYSYFSKVTLTAKSDNRLVVEANGSYRDTRIYLGEGNEVIFGDGSSIMNSTITLCDYNRFLLEKNNRIQDTQIQLFRENVFEMQRDSIYEGNTKMLDKARFYIGSFCEIVSDNSVYYSGRIAFGDSVKAGGQKNEHFSFMQKNIFLIADYGELIVGNGSLFSIGIKIICGDGHAIFDTETGEKVNYKKNRPINRVIIGNHVWIGEDVSLIQGTDIGDGSIVGTKSLVNGKFPERCIIAGIPAKIIKVNRTWHSDYVEGTLEEAENCLKGS